MPVPAAAIRRQIRDLRRATAAAEATAEAAGEFARGFHTGAAFALGQAANRLAALLAEADLDQDEDREPAAIYTWSNLAIGRRGAVVERNRERHYDRVSRASLARLRHWAEAHGWEIEAWADEDPRTGTCADRWAARPPR